MAVRKRSVGIGDRSGGAPVAARRNQCPQLAEVGRLDQVMIETCLRGSLKMLLFTVPAMGNQQGVVLTRHRTDAASDLITIHLGQANIEQHDVRAEFLDAAQGSWPVTGRLHVVSVDPQQRGTAFQRIDVIVHDKNSHGADRQYSLCRDSYRIFEYGAARHGRQADYELATAVESFAVRPYAAPMQFDQAMHQRQAKTEARGLAVERALGLHKDIEDRRDEFSHHANTVVDHRQQRVIQLSFDRDPDMTAWARVFDRVAQQVGDDLFYPHRVRGDRQHVHWESERDLVLACLEFRAHGLDGATHGLDEIDSPGLENDNAPRDPRHIQQILDQTDLVIELPLRRHARDLLRLLVGAAPFPDLQAVANGGERVA